MNRQLKCYLDLMRKLRPQLTDVSLRDGIQGALPSSFPTAKKKDTLHHIMTQTAVSHVEVGSLVSPKVLPIMADTLDVYRFGSQWCNRPSDTATAHSHSYKESPKLGVLVPNLEKLHIALENSIPFISMITSVSDDFQRKNVRKSLVDTKLELQTMCSTVRQMSPSTYLKLYISCINKCPIIGEVSNDTIISELLCYTDHFDFDELCLSDTCGTLTLNDFKCIIAFANKHRVPINKLSVHLHVLPNNEAEVEGILFHCFEKGIRKFDVSLLDTGGCSVTMGKNVKPNLSHEHFFRVFYRYLRSKMEE